MMGAATLLGAKVSNRLTEHLTSRLVGTTHSKFTIEDEKIHYNILEKVAKLFTYI